ncbi:MAG: TonB C-terminal domain-containing protein [Opitutaceae bacterium]
MTARSPSAFFLSASLHGLIVAVVVLFTYLSQINVKEPPKILTLVQGPGDDYNATAAPALGSPSGIKIAIPEPAAPVAPTPTPPAPVAAVEPVTEPSPVKPAPVQKPVPKTPSKPTETKAPDFSRQIKKTIIRKESQAKREIKKARDAEQKRLTKEEFDRQNKAAKVAAANGNPKVKHIDTKGIGNGAPGGSSDSKTGAGGKALTREEGDVLDAYFALVQQKLLDGLEKPPGLSDSLTADAEFRLNVDGSISSGRITRSSGSDEFDRAVLSDIHRVGRVGNPPRTWKGGTLNVTFRMKDQDSG